MQSIEIRHQRPVVWLLILICGTMIASPNLSRGQDTLLLKTDDGNITKRTGTITGWAGSQINLATGGRIKKIDSTTVTEIQTNWPAELEEARQLMAGGMFAEATPKLQAALESEDRDWVKQIVTAELVQCLDATDKTEVATIQFLKLYSADPDTRFFHLIPLPWSSNSIYAPNGTQTQKWLDSKTSLLRLLGASWQLSGVSRSKAMATLNELSSDKDQRIAQLAATQLWRTDLLTADEKDIGRWERIVQNLPEELQAGPLIVLAQAQTRNRQPDQAKINLMKIPILHPEKKSLAALALFRCGSILEDEGKNDQAKMVRRELVSGFPGSQYSKSARQK